MDLNEWRDECGRAMKEKGFHERTDNGELHTMKRLALIVTEVAEAMQVVKRHWGKCHRYTETMAEFSEEIADVFIRLFDLAYCIGINLETAVDAKMAKNMSRPHKYGTPQEEPKA